MDIDSMRQDFQEKMSFILGIAHGGIGVILDGSDEEMRDRLADLKAKLDSLIGDLYYRGAH